MFAPEETPLLVGSDSDVQDFVDCSRCMVIDWRSDEEEVIEDAIRFLPAGTLEYEWLDAGQHRLLLKFNGRENVVELKHAAGDNWRVLLSLTKVVRPDYEILLFQSSEGSDTACLLLRPAAWWQAFRGQYPERFRKLFTTMEERPHLWGLSEEELPHPPKLWWKLW